MNIDSRVINLPELRIGNNLLYKGRLVYVTMISLDIDDEYEETIGFCEVGTSSKEIAAWNRSLVDNLQRIPLTPEWLRKFGFITLDAETDIEVWGLDDNSNGEEFSIVSDGLYTPLPLYFEYDLGYRQRRKEIKYLHQLQNLYHSLTGEELNIKEPV